MPNDARIDVAALDALLAPHDHTDAPGFAVGVALRGRVGYRRGVGMASIELPVALSPTIRMRIGSTSKHFCCLAIMLLAEDGRLDPDDSPRRHLPELPAWAEGFTLRQLMSHTSGMRDTVELLLASGGAGRPMPTDIQLRLLRRLDDVDAAPGTTWSYNNAGYELLSAIIERTSGQSLGEFYRDRIFGPVGMNDTTQRVLDTDLLPNSATLHVPTAGGGWRRGVFGMPIHGMGGIVSTVDDMLLWLRHMSAPTVGSRETWEQMRAPNTTHGYGLGLFTDTHRGLRTVHHAGAVIGGHCQMLKVIDHELDLIVMTNGAGGMARAALVDAIIDRCIPGLPPPPAPPGGPAAEGWFHSAASGRLVGLAAGKDGGQALVVSGLCLPALAEPDGAWSVPLLPTDLRVTPVREDGRVVALDVVEFGSRERLSRVQPGEAGPTSPLAGAYAHEPTGMVATVRTAADGGATLRLAGPTAAGEQHEDYDLDPVGPRLWRTRSASEPGVPGPLLEFGEDGMRLSTGRVNRLRFVRRG